MNNSVRKSDIESKRIGNTVETYVYEPQFIVSKKDSIKLSVSGTDKTEWTVIKAPENVHGGRYEKQYQVDENKDSPTYGQTIEIEDARVDKWTWLIDGQAGTYLQEPEVPFTRSLRYLPDSSANLTVKTFLT